MESEQPRAARKTAREFDREIDELCGETRDLGKRLSSFAGALAAFLEDADVALHLYDEEGDEFTLQGSSIRERGGEHPALHAGRTIQGLALAERRVVSLSESPGKGQKLQAEEHVFPLEAGGRCHGAVTVVRIAAEGLSPLRLDQARRGVTRFAATLGAARDEARRARRMDRLSAINEFGVILVSAHTLEEVPALATAMTSFIMGTEGCILRLRDAQGAGSAVRDAHGLREESANREILKLEEQASRQVLHTGKVLLVRDVARDPAFRDTTARVRSFICCPIAGASGTIGTITLFNKSPESRLLPAHLGREDQEVLLHLVRYIEKALANAALFARSRELAERDELTGLPDRTNFQARLLSEINRARRFQQRIALVTCELQPPAAPEGPPAGFAVPQMIQRLAQAIRAAVREYDIVGRIGERTFGIILPQVQNGTVSPVTRIQMAIDREIEKHRAAGGDGQLLVRFSHATFPDDASSGEQMLTRLENGG